MVLEILDKHITDSDFFTVNEVVTRQLGHVPVVKVCFISFRTLSYFRQVGR